MWKKIFVNNQLVVHKSQDSFNKMAKKAVYEMIMSYEKKAINVAEASPSSQFRF